MRSFSTLVVIAVSAVLVASQADAQQNQYYGSPSLLPTPRMPQSYGGQQQASRGAALHYVSQQPTQAGYDGHQPAIQASGQAHAEVVQPVPEQGGHVVYEGQGGYAGEGSACGTGVGGCSSGTCGYSGYGEDVGYSLYGGGSGGHGWFASASGLIMGLDADDHTKFSYDNTAGARTSILSSKDAEMDYSGGVEFRVGKYFNCGQNAVEFIYWGVFPSSQTVTATAAAANDVRSYTDYQWVTNPSGAATGDTYSVGSSAQRLRRDWEFHNVELNFMSFNYSCGFGGFGGQGGYGAGSACGCGGAGCSACSSCSTGSCSGPGFGLGHLGGLFQPRGFMTTWGIGARYFRFDDFLEFSAASGGNPSPYFYEDTRQLNHAVDIENNLVGLQLNGAIDYQLSCKLKFRAATKLGVYGNHVSHRQTITNSAGYFTVNGGRTYDYRSNKDDIAFIGEIDLGMNYQINCHWNASIGYRAMVASGVALSSSQLPQDLRDVSDVQYIETNNSLLLHGAYAGLEFNY